MNIRTYRSVWPVLLLSFVIGSCTLQAHSDQSSKAALPIEQFLKQRVHADANKNIFIVFAFLNAAGYDFENTEHMHPVRACSEERD